MKITSLTLSSLRGIPSGWPTLRVGERGLVVLGPNGAGKSSIIDGLEFAITGSSSLFPENRTGVNWTAASRHIKGGVLQVDMTLKSSGRDHLLTTTAAPTSAVAAWLADAAKSRFVLRRHMLLKFIEGSPKDRYTRLEPFLNLDKYIKIEQTLESLVLLMRTNVVAEEAAASKNEQKLRAIFAVDDGDIISKPLLTDSINLILSKVGVAELCEDGDLGAVEQMLDSELKGFAQDSRLTSLQGLKARVQKLTLPITFRPLLDHLRTTLSDLEVEEKASSKSIPTDFLSRGRDLISATSAKHCPICEKSIEYEAVIARLNERIISDTKLAGAQSAVRAAKRAALGPIEFLMHAVEQFIIDWHSIMPVRLNEKYEQASDLLKDTVMALNAKLDVRIVHHLSARFSAALESHEEASALISFQIEKEAGGDRRKLLSEACVMLRALQKDWPLHERARERVVLAHRKQRSSERLHGHSVEARKRTVQYILDDVAGIANEYYDELHPGEGIAKSKLIVRQNQEGSVILQTEFYGKEGSPLLHYSESHLDTLGLCYFLALRKREARNSSIFKLVVLDDVMHSVDSRHRAKFASLLKREFDDHQVILVTHDEIFYQRLRQTIGSKCNFVTITDWDINRGPFLGDASTDLDVILDENLQRSKSARDLASACGRFFEWLLRNATENLSVAIPARFSRNHDIGNMWPPLAAKIRKQKHFISRMPAICEEVETHSWVRNAIGAHYNENDAPPDPEEVRQFARSLSKLYGALHCDGCGGFIVKVSDNDWRCKCGALNYAQIGE
ncbi:AAA family ATPase [Methylorubrum populi]|uniref:AAA family ATPase n=1 Tax=Methylorubrum populi TaxID=223967 RepID=UPI003F6594AF